MQGNTYIFFGTAGSGKGTQSELLAKALKDKKDIDSVYVSLGSEFRNLINSGTYAGKVIEESINKGEYQPDFITNAIFSNFLFSNFNPKKNLITDGYPRTLEQAKFLEKSMDFYSRSSLTIFNLHVSEEEVVRRMKLRARGDDTEEGIKQRFKEHEKNVLPAIEYLQHKEGYEFFEINGEQSVEDVHREIIGKLGL